LNISVGWFFVSEHFQNIIILLLLLLLLLTRVLGFGLQKFRTSRNQENVKEGFIYLGSKNRKT
jgi:hypothetical protein